MMKSKSTSPEHDQDHRDLVIQYALQAIPASERLAMEAQLSACADCRQEMESLRPVVQSLAFWPTDLLRPSESLWGRLATRIAVEAGTEPVLTVQPQPTPAREQVAPGISCQMLATDMEKNRVTLLVRLAPGADYPPHRHAGVEELYLLYGELMIDEKKLYPGDYVRAEARTVDHRVWSQTGCTCVLLTSTKDLIL